MNPKPDKPITATVTSKARLTIKGQVIDLTIQELEALHAEISKALNKPDKPVVVFRDSGSNPPHYYRPAISEPPMPWDDRSKVMCRTISPPGGNVCSSSVDIKNIPGTASFLL